MGRSESLHETSVSLAGIVERPVQWGLARLGGKASAEAIAIFAAVLALDGADKGAIGAMAEQLEHAFGIGNTELGLMITLSSAVSAIATLPFGWLADRVNRTRLLALAVLLWGASMAVTACTTSYLFLLFTRVALGAVSAAAAPTVASLVGDWFDPGRRGRVYGAILSGEIVGTGFGFVVAGQLATFSWRIGVASLVVPALLLAWVLKKTPEPVRGGASRIALGQAKLEPHGHHRDDPNLERREPQDVQPVKERVREEHVPPREHLVLDVNPAEKSLLWAMWYVLRVPTNVVLIIASALGYYFFSGVRIFGVELVGQTFHLGHSNTIWVLLGVGLSGVVGVALGGFFGDRLLASGRLAGRVVVASSAYLAMCAFFLVFLLAPRPPFGILTLVLAAMALGAMNPPLDAARLDIMHPHMWGRAESVRMFFRLIGEAIAPVLFGFSSEHVFHGGAKGLQHTFMIMLIPLFVSGFISFIAIRTYPRDVATADAYARRTCGRAAR